MAVEKLTEQSPARALDLRNQYYRRLYRRGMSAQIGLCIVEIGYPTR
jgi:hypothetical protein